ncbi:hypothetical protein Nit79A3_1983 [Nitrosomonas sp. Is79A3]|uniref:RES domain-containing protein n=1 Tax=Nitrosomonas sp. (strain Is79A3) TaxID=261292 RepID=UPI000215CEFF
MSNENIRSLIQQLNRIDVNKADYEYIVSLFRKAIYQVVIYVSLTRSTDLYFRAVIWKNEKPKKIDNFKAPPAELVKGFQRCNPPNTPMFYSASKRITALLECDVQVGDTVYLSQWVNKKPVPVNRILFPDKNYESNVKLTLREMALYSYVDTIFTRPVHEAFSNVYKITAAVTEALTTGFTPLQDSGLDIREDGTVGLIYPSITDIEDSYNVVFHADFAEERLQLTHVMELVVKKREGKKITIEVNDNAIEFPDGNITWLNNRFSIPKLRNSLDHLEFKGNGRAWVIPVKDTFHSPEEIDDLLNENANNEWL